MPIYHFRLRIHGRLLEEGGWLELADRDSALRKARKLACALLSFGDERVSWMDGVLVVECSDGSEPITVPLADAMAEASAPLH
jgi:hypothetical protein